MTLKELSMINHLIVWDFKLIFEIKIEFKICSKISDIFIS